mmetsp:Transcript_2981/g.10096  ORF Transcript_2981/g.10096 Transcript_2981/m.10096 type:complete len:224 (-) Transcript_2981:1551-2222(-)
MRPRAPLALRWGGMPRSPRPQSPQPLALSRCSGRRRGWSPPQRLPGATPPPHLSPPPGPGGRPPLGALGGSEWMARAPRRRMRSAGARWSSTTPGIWTCCAASSLRRCRTASLAAGTRSASATPRRRNPCGRWAPPSPRQEQEWGRRRTSPWSSPRVWWAAPCESSSGRAWRTSCACTTAGPPRSSGTGRGWARPCRWWRSSASSRTCGGWGGGTSCSPPRAP